MSPDTPCTAAPIAMPTVGVAAGRRWAQLPVPQIPGGLACVNEPWDAAARTASRSDSTQIDAAAELERIFGELRAAASCGR